MAAEGISHNPGFAVTGSPERSIGFVDYREQASATKQEQGSEPDIEAIKTNALAQERLSLVRGNLAEARNARAETLADRDRDPLNGEKVRNGLFFWRAIRRKVLSTFSDITNAQSDLHKAESKAAQDMASGEKAAGREMINAAVEGFIQASQGSYAQENKELMKLIADRYGLESTRSQSTNATLDKIKAGISANSYLTNMVIGATFRVCFRGLAHVGGLGGAMLTSGIYGGVSQGIKEGTRLRREELGATKWQEQLDSVESPGQRLALARGIIEDKDSFNRYFGGDSTQAFAFFNYYQTLLKDAGTAGMAEGVPDEIKNELEKILKSKKYWENVLGAAGKGAAIAAASAAGGYAVAHIISGIFHPAAAHAQGSSVTEPPAQGPGRLGVPTTAPEVPAAPHAIPWRMGEGGHARLEIDPGTHVFHEAPNQYAEVVVGDKGAYGTEGASPEEVAREIAKAITHNEDGTKTFEMTHEQSQQFEGHITRWLKNEKGLHFVDRQVVPVPATEVNAALQAAHINSVDSGAADASAAVAAPAGGPGVPAAAPPAGIVDPMAPPGARVAPVPSGGPRAATSGGTDSTLPPSDQARVGPRIDTSGGSTAAGVVAPHEAHGAPGATTGGQDSTLPPPEQAPSKPIDTGKSSAAAPAASALASRGGVGTSPAGGIVDPMAPPGARVTPVPSGGSGTSTPDTHGGSGGEGPVSRGAAVQTPDTHRPGDSATPSAKGWTESSWFKISTSVAGLAVFTAVCWRTIKKKRENEVEKSKKEDEPKLVGSSTATGLASPAAPADASGAAPSEQAAADAIEFEEIVGGHADEASPEPPADSPAEPGSDQAAVGTPEAVPGPVEGSYDDLKQRAFDESEAGRYKESLELYLEAEGVMDDAIEPARRESLYINIGHCALNAYSKSDPKDPGFLTTAIEYFEKAIKDGDSIGWHVNVLERLGFAYYRLAMNETGELKAGYLQKSEEYLAGYLEKEKKSGPAKHAGQGLLKVLEEQGRDDEYINKVKERFPHAFSQAQPSGEPPADSGDGSSSEPPAGSGSAAPVPAAGEAPPAPPAGSPPVEAATAEAAPARRGVRAMVGGVWSRARESVAERAANKQDAIKNKEFLEGRFKEEKDKGLHAFFRGSMVLGDSKDKAYPILIRGFDGNLKHLLSKEEIDEIKFEEPVTKGHVLEIKLKLNKGEYDLSATDEAEPVQLANKYPRNRDAVRVAAIYATARQDQQAFKYRDRYREIGSNEGGLTEELLNSAKGYIDKGDYVAGWNLARGAARNEKDNPQQAALASLYMAAAMCLRGYGSAGEEGEDLEMLIGSEIDVVYRSDPKVIEREKDWLTAHELWERFSRAKEGDGQPPAPEPSQPPQSPAGGEGEQPPPAPQGPAGEPDAQGGEAGPAEGESAGGEQQDPVQAEQVASGRSEQETQQFLEENERLIKAGNAQEAYDRLDEALKLENGNSDNGPLHWQTGSIALFNLGDYENAVAHLKQADRPVEPQFMGILEKMAAGDFSGALESFKSAKVPKDATELKVYYGLAAIICDRLDDATGAREYLDKVGPASELFRWERLDEVRNKFNSQSPVQAPTDTDGPSPAPSNGPSGGEGIVIDNDDLPPGPQVLDVKVDPEDDAPDASRATTRRDIPVNEEKLQAMRRDNPPVERRPERADPLGGSMSLLRREAEAVGMGIKLDGAVIAFNQRNWRTAFDGFLAVETVGREGDVITNKTILDERIAESALEAGKSESRPDEKRRLIEIAIPRLERLSGPIPGNLPLLAEAYLELSRFSDAEAKRELCAKAVSTVDEFVRFTGADPMKQSDIDQLMLVEAYAGVGNRAEVDKRRNQIMQNGSAYDRARLVEILKGQ